MNRAGAAQRRTAITRCGEINPTGRVACRRPSLRDEFTSFPEPAHSPDGTANSKHVVPRPTQSINAKPRSHSLVRRRRTNARYELEIAGNGTAGHGQPGLIRNGAQSGLVRITAASWGNSTDNASRPMRCRLRLYAGDDHVRLDEDLKLLMSKSLRALNERLPWSVSRGQANSTASLTCPIVVP